METTSAATHRLQRFQWRRRESNLDARSGDSRDSCGVAEIMLDSWLAGPVWYRADPSRRATSRDIRATWGALLAAGVYPHEHLHLGTPEACGCPALYSTGPLLSAYVLPRRPSRLLHRGIEWASRPQRARRPPVVASDEGYRNSSRTSCGRESSRSPQLPGPTWGCR
jgi:hypothetical protein